MFLTPIVLVYTTTRKYHVRTNIGVSLRLHYVLLVFYTAMISPIKSPVTADGRKKLNLVEMEAPASTMIRTSLAAEVMLYMQSCTYKQPPNRASEGADEHMFGG